MNIILKKYKDLSEPVKASLWYTICNIVNKGIALFSTPIFTRVMSEEEYGTFAIFQSWYSIFIIFTSLNLFLSCYQKGLVLFKDDRDRFTASQLGLTTFLTICFFVVYIIRPRFWSNIFELSVPLMIAMFLELLFMPALEFWSIEERFDFKYKKYVIISILMTFFSLCFGIISVINSQYKIEARVFSDVFVKIIFSGIIFVGLFLRGKKIIVFKYWKYGLSFSLPLLPHYLSNYILSQSDRIMIGRMIGNNKAAFYSVAYTISTMMMLIITAINSSFTPYLYKKMDEIEKKENIHKMVICQNVRRVTMPLCLLVMVLSILTMLFAPEVIFLFAGSNYAEAIYVIPPVAMSVFFIFIYSLFSNIEFYCQKTKNVAIATFLSAGLNLILNYIFIPKFGYYAAGYTTLISYIFLALMHYLFYRKIIKSMKISELFNIKAICFMSVLTLVTMLLVVLMYKNLFMRLGMAIILLSICYLKRKVIISVINYIK